MGEAAQWLVGFEAGALLVFALAFGLDRLLRGRSAATRRGLWALAFVIVLVSAMTRLVLPPARQGLGMADALAGALVLVWAMGAAALLARLAAARREVARIVAESRPLSSRSGWHVELERLRGDRAIDLRSHAELASPICVGARRSTLVVPESLLDATPEQRRSLLVHELAHVVRSDVALLQIASLVRALCWIDPLAWWALDRLREQAEVAADDAVLGAGVASSSYAAYLVALARDGLSRAVGLRSRVLAILDVDRRRSGSLADVTRWTTASTLALAIAFASMLTACEARAEPSAPADSTISASP